MSTQQRIERIDSLKNEFRTLIEFHESSFREIDAKAKYWLTLTLPSFVALLGYLTKQWASLPLTLLAGGSALAVCLVASIYLFSSVLLSRRVESGILVPSSRLFQDAVYFLETDENWRELREDQAQEMLHAITNNEAQNAHKAAKMRRGEVSLFRGTPAAICLAGSCAFAYTAACPSGFAATGIGISTAGAIAGTAIGGCTAAAFVAFDHFSTLKRKERKL